MLRRRNATTAIVVVFHTQSIHSPIISPIPSRNLCKSFSRSTGSLQFLWSNILISFAFFVSVVQTIDLFSLNLWPVVCAPGGLKFDSKFLLFLSSQFLLFLVFVIFRFTHCASFWIDLFYFFRLLLFNNNFFEHRNSTFFSLLIYSFSSFTGKMMPPTNWTRTASAHITCYKISN